MDYINDIILYIHGFCDRLLANLCMEEYVRDNLWAVLVEEILLIYKKIIEQVTPLQQESRKSSCGKIKRG